MPGPKSAHPARSEEWMSLADKAGRLACGAAEYFWFYVAALYFAIGGVLYTVVSAILYVVLPRRVGIPLGRHVIGMLFRSFLGLLRTTGLVRLDLTALEALRHERGLIIAPNHPCLLDAVFVIAYVPSVSCIMKAEIWDNVVLGGGARLAGYIRNDAPLNMVRLAAQELRDGHPLLVFPEGTRTRHRPVNRFKGGFALMAKRAGAPIQTVFIETESAFLGKGWPLLRKPVFPLVYRARLGRRLSVEGNAKAFVHGLEEYYREDLAAQELGQASDRSRGAASPRVDPVA